MKQLVGLLVCLMLCSFSMAEIVSLPFEKSIKHDVSANMGQGITIIVDFIDDLDVSLYDGLTMRVKNRTKTSMFSVRLVAGENSSYWVTLAPGMEYDLEVPLPETACDVRIAYSCFVGTQYGYATFIDLKISQVK